MAQFCDLQVKLVLPSVIVIFASSVAACAEGPPAQPQSASASSGQVVDYLSLIYRLRALGAHVESNGEVDQPFFSAKGQAITVDGEDIQVFQYDDPATADAEAALVSPDGSAVGTSKPHWIASPHFFKKDKLLVLYVGDNGALLKLLEAALGRPFAGSPRYRFKETALTTQKMDFTRYTG